MAANALLAAAIKNAVIGQMRDHLTGKVFAGRVEGVEWSVTITHLDDITIDLDVAIPEPPIAVRVITDG